MKQERLKQEKDASYKKTVPGIGMSVYEMSKTQFNEVAGVTTRKQKKEEDSSSEEEEDLTERVKRLKSEKSLKK